MEGPLDSLRLSPCPVRGCGRRANVSIDARGFVLEILEESVCPPCEQSINRCVSRSFREQRERLTGQRELDI